MRAAPLYVSIQKDTRDRLVGLQPCCQLTGFEMRGLVLKLHCTCAAVKRCLKAVCVKLPALHWYAATACAHTYTLASFALHVQAMHVCMHACMLVRCNAALACTHACVHV
jgi:hypothetical protein